MLNEHQKQDQETSILNKLKNVEYMRAKGAAYKSAALKALQKKKLSFIRELTGDSNILPTLNAFERVVGYYTIESNIMTSSQLAYDIGYYYDYIHAIKRKVYTELKIKESSDSKN